MTTATAVGYVEMRIAKVVGLATAEDQPFQYVVLEEMVGDRQLAIERQLRIDQVVEDVYIATVEVEGPPAVQS